MMTVPAPYDVSSGDGVLVGSLFGVAAYNAAQGSPVEIATTGVFDLPKTAGDTPAQFGHLYWNAAARAITTTSAGNALVGIAALSALGDG